MVSLFFTFIYQYVAMYFQVSSQWLLKKKESGIFMVIGNKSCYFSIFMGI